MKKISILFLAASLLYGCGAGKTYPEQVKQNFINGCAAKVKGNTGICDCLFEKIQNKYSYIEYIKIEEKMKVGQTPQDFLHFIDSATLSCYKELKNK